MKTGIGNHLSFLKVGYNSWKKKFKQKELDFVPIQMNIVYPRNTYTGLPPFYWQLQKRYGLIVFIRYTALIRTSLKFR